MKTSDLIPKTAGPIIVCVSALCVACAFTACRTRTIYVPDGDPVRLREPVRGAKVWVADENGQWTAGEIDIPAGWYALPDPGPGEVGSDSDVPLR